MVGIFLHFSPNLSFLTFEKPILTLWPFIGCKLKEIFLKLVNKETLWHQTEFHPKKFGVWSLDFLM